MKKDLLKKKLFFIKRKMLLDIGVKSGKVEHFSQDIIERMDNTINASDFERIYETKQFWIGRIGGVQFESFYLVISDQRAVSSQIAVNILHSFTSLISSSLNAIKPFTNSKAFSFKALILLSIASRFPAKQPARSFSSACVI